MGLGQPSIGKRARQNSENDNNTNTSAHPSTTADDMKEDMWMIMNKRARELPPDCSPSPAHITAQPMSSPRVPLMGCEITSNWSNMPVENQQVTSTISSSSAGYIGSSSSQISSSESTDCTDGSMNCESSTKRLLHKSEIMDSSICPNGISIPNSAQKSYPFSRNEATCLTMENSNKRNETPTTAASSSSVSSYQADSEDYPACSSKRNCGSEQPPSDSNQIIFKTVQMNRVKGPRFVVRSKYGKICSKSPSSKESVSSSSSSTGTSVEDSEIDECSDTEARSKVNRETVIDECLAEDLDEHEGDSEGEAESDIFDFIPPSSEPAETVEGLRKSLFPFVPPYIHFCQHNQVSQSLSSEIRKKLKWRLSPITPVVVKKTVEASGFRLLRNTVEWTGQWGKHMKASLFRSAVKDYQKLNHLPGTFQIGRKDRLWKNLQRFMLKFGKDAFGFMPRTYVLPKEMKQLKQAWFHSETKGNPWIIKPPAGARGTGIRVINKWAQIPKKKPIIVQKYIQNPLLIDGRKFDLRLYVLVTSFHPLKIYLYDDGLVRFAPVKYKTDKALISNLYMHLTNYSINKNCELYTQNEDAEACVGHKWTLKALWRLLREKGENVERILYEIHDIVIKTILCAEEPISSLAFNMPNRYTGYELFGFDIILDDKLKPWLLEVNISPSLHSNSPLDLAVKGPLIAEVFNIVGYHLPPHLPTSANGQKKIFRKMQQPHFSTNSGPKFNGLLYSGNLSKAAKAKHSEYRLHFNDRKKYLDDIITDLTSDDIRQLTTAYDEMSQCVGFQRVFPSGISHEYFNYFESPRYYNMLLDGWEYKYGQNHKLGVERLVDLCTLKLHYQDVALSSHGVKAISSDQIVSSKSQEQATDADNIISKCVIDDDKITEEDEEDDSNYCSLSASESVSECNSTENLFTPPPHQQSLRSCSMAADDEGIGHDSSSVGISTKAESVHGVC